MSATRLPYLGWQSLEVGARKPEVKARLSSCKCKLVAAYLAFKAGDEKAGLRSIQEADEIFRSKSKNAVQALVAKHS